jgi:putative GTP pyrophosphokinase
MDDVAGCRLIFENIEQLVRFRDRLHRARFNHRLRNDPDKYDYILNPKHSGYRGVHDVYEYDVNSESGKDHKGLYIELQYRTIYQHAWATAVEVVGHITENQPKFDQGDDRFKRQLRLASEIIARAWENLTSSEPDMADEDVVHEFVELDEQTHLMAMLRSLNTSDADLTEKKNMILVFQEGSKLEMFAYRDATDALKALFELEKQFPGHDIVLVKADTNEEVREAFKNYFSDARDFIRLIEDGCKVLMEHRTIDMAM